ncbi:serine-rich coiled-coil domain-containing protein 1 isoform X1 [Tachysurus vachellii]|uniref:serine-rich coiled-coil domain-containing protein 1 isoform X1 n=2 Tax=Tachysurus vachellii TaxID=175792 RepID=UPI00296AE965|nr:serine-rich coiled-coil domain-containing protein 1 isoform X1 [Tachysurus vachellii]
MGESGPRRSTLVSRLPIFRRSARKKQDSLPSSPSSGGVGNGVHTSSPSSTNSSSSSTGKRRSLFRTPSISFHSKRNSESRADSNQFSADNRSRLSEPSFNDSCNKTRHSFGFGGHKKKLSRSQTEDFEKTPTNRNVFINCISSRTNEADDSGFLDDVSSKRSSKSKKLLPKSFSAHHRFSKNYSNQVEQNQGKDDAPKTGTPGSWPGELADSLQSPIVSEDRTTAITPSDFVHVTEDTVSEVDALPVPSPAEVPPENMSQGVSTSQTCAKPDQSTVEKPILPDMNQTADTKCESTTVQTEPETQNKAVEQHQNPNETSENELNPEPSEEEGSSNAEPRGRTHRNTVLVQQLGKSAGLGKLESRPSYLRKPHTVSMCSSMSPRREVIRLERRLRSASEGAGGPNLHLNLKEHTCMEASMLAKHRTNSSSSKLGSLDFLNNLGSSELDEDDLMLDLELSDDQRHRHASQEDSCQSLASCLNLLPSPLELPTDQNTAKECRENNRESRPVSLFVPCDDELFPGLETLPFRLMQQDCTAMKTLLLRLRRLLQESTEPSPASSLHSLPISPCSEKSPAFKDPGRDESHSLQQQLKERDELILLLQTELEAARSAQRPLCQKTDKTTQTDPPAPEAVHPSRAIGNSSSSLPRERRSARLSSLGEERHSGGTGIRDPAALQRRSEQTYSSSSEATTPRKLDHPGPSQIPRAVVSGSTCSLSSDSERLTMARPHSSFSGRLGQPPRGPLSLHMYSRKNVFLQHSLYTTELQALGQQDA